LTGAANRQRSHRVECTGNRPNLTAGWHDATAALSSPHACRARGDGQRPREKLTYELVVPMDGLKVAIQLPEELQSADRLTLDFADNSFVLVYA